VTRQIRVEKQDGSSFTLPLTAGDLHRYDVFANRPDQARLVTDTTSAQAQTLDLGQDEVYFDDNGTDAFGGYLVDVKRRDDETTLMVNGFESDASHAQTYSKTYTGVADTTIVNDAISNMPNLSAGTVDAVTSGLSFVFKRVTPAKVLRVVARTTGGAVRYNADKTVDYLASPGTSRSDTITRDKAAGQATAVEQFRVKEAGGGNQITHLKMLGAGRGQPQREATIVPSADGGSYVNKVTYSSSWSSGDRKIWPQGPYTNKDHTDVSTLQEEGKQLVAELNTTHVEVETDTTFDNVVLGDSFKVEDDRQSIDQRLTVVELTRTLRSSMDLFDLTLSSRQQSRERAQQKQSADTSRYNTVFEGDVIFFTAGRDRKPATGTDNYVLPVKYPPDVIEEMSLDLHIKGDAYRSFASPTEHGHGVKTTSDVVPGEADAERLSFEWSSNFQSNLASTPITNQSLTNRSYPTTALFTFQPDSGESTLIEELTVVVKTGTGNDYFLMRDPGSSPKPFNGLVSCFGLIHEDLSSTTFDVQVDVITGDGSDIAAKGVLYMAGPTPHAHSIDDTTDATAGLSPGTATWDGSDQSPAHYPDSVDVIIGGSSEGTSYGDGTGPIDVTHDITGKLSGGSNTIELDAAGICDLDAEVRGFLYIQRP